MSLLIMNDHKYYITHDNKGILRKTNDKSQAEDFISLERAIEQCRHNPKKTRGYYVFDTATMKVCFKNPKKKKKNRKKYSKNTRLLIYTKANGCCELCGRNILVSDMTIDHIKPISMGGIDELSNLQCACKICNELKGNILPETFIERISTIYLYQMEKKFNNNVRWRIAQRLLNKMV